MRILLILFGNLLIISQLTVPAATGNSADDVKPIKFPDYLSQASLTIQANVYFGNEDEESVAVQTDFYLLNENPAVIYYSILSNQFKQRSLVSVPLLILLANSKAVIYHSLKTFGG